jgi:hypothetical protein
VAELLLMAAAAVTGGETARERTWEGAGRLWRDVTVLTGIFIGREGEGRCRAARLSARRQWWPRSALEKSRVTTGRSGRERSEEGTRMHGLSLDEKQPAGGSSER